MGTAAPKHAPTGSAGCAFWVGPPGASLAVGSKGWLFWDFDAELDVRVRVDDFDGAFRPTTVAVGRADGRPVTGEELRAVPLRRLSDALTLPALTEAVRAAWNKKGAPDLSPSTTREVVLERVRRLVVQSLGPDGGAASSPVANASSRARKDDAFYFDMLDRYNTLSASSRRPAIELAEQQGVKVSTVHRWLREAKYRRAMLVANARRIETGLRD